MNAVIFVEMQWKSSLHVRRSGNSFLICLHMLRYDMGLLHIPHSGGGAMGGIDTTLEADYAGIGGIFIQGIFSLPQYLGIQQSD